MTIYSFYLFDRHCDCVYTKHWKARANDQMSSTDISKLIFGATNSLRNTVRKLSPGTDSFVSFKTNKYKLHFFETPSSLRFIIISDPGSENMLPVLRQIFVSLYVEYVVKNPLSLRELHSHSIVQTERQTKIESNGRSGTEDIEMVDCELFTLALDQFVASLANFN